MAKKNFNFKKINLDLGNLKGSLGDLNNLKDSIDLSNLNTLKESLSDTISTVADKVLDFADSAADTAKVGQQIAKLYVEKKKEESALEDAYTELGRLYYELHKTEAEGVLADLCMEIEHTLVNIEDIDAEIEALKQSSDVVFDDMTEFEDDDFEEEDGFLERMADTVEEALEGLDDAIEAALDKLEVAAGIPIIDDDDIEVTVEEYEDDALFAVPAEDDDVEVEIIEVEDEEDDTEVEVEVFEEA